MDLALRLDSDSTAPLHEQIYRQLRDAILSGRLRPQQQLPASRTLAQSLQVSRSTVSLSYDRLLSEGYLQTRRGAGTFVCAQLPETLSQALPLPSGLPPAPHTVSVGLSSYGEAIAAQPPWQPEAPAEIHFRYGRSAMDQFPLKLWSRLQSRQMQTSRNWMDYTGEIQGYAPLRQALAEYLGRSRAVRCTPEQIVITHGTQQAIQLVAQLLISPGEAVACENPGYVSSRRIFQSRGAQILPLPVDEDGLQIDLLEQHKPSPKLVFVTPSHQFPTGALLSLPRRLRLLAWARANQALIIEDDYDSEYRYSSRPIPALQGLEANAPVIYTGTFAKVLFPGLRIGYAVLPDVPNAIASERSPHLSRSLVEIFAQARWHSDRHSSLLDQATLTDFIIQGHLDRHIRRMRLLYSRRRSTLVQALKTQFGDSIRLWGQSAGLHIMVQWRLGLSHAEIQSRAQAAGVGLIDASPHFFNAFPSERTFILGYAELEESAIAEGIERLATALLDDA